MLFAFNHVLKPYPAIRLALARYTGRRIAVVLPPFQVKGVITEQGSLAACQGEAEATIQLRVGAMLSIIRGKVPELSDMIQQGDAELASAVFHILAQCQWDPTEELSQLVGDMPAQYLETCVRSAWNGHRQLICRMLENGLDQQDLVQTTLVNAFIQQVDNMREDVDRLEKRLARLESRMDIQMSTSKSTQSK